jgi:transcriptional regulator with XRE-family HTH domain
VHDDSLHRQLVERLRVLASKRGWTPTQLSAEAGLSKSQMSRLMNLQQSPTLSTLRRLAVALEVNTRELLPRDDERRD